MAWQYFIYACGHAGRVLAEKLPAECVNARCASCQKPDPRKAAYMRRWNEARRRLTK